MLHVSHFNFSTHLISAPLSIYREHGNNSQGLGGVESAQVFRYHPLDHQASRVVLFFPLATQTTLGSCDLSKAPGDWNHHLSLSYFRTSHRTSFIPNLAEIGSALAQIGRLPEDFLHIM